MRRLTSFCATMAVTLIMAFALCTFEGSAAAPLESENYSEAAEEIASDNEIEIETEASPLASGTDEEGRYAIPKIIVVAVVGLSALAGGFAIITKNSNKQ